LHSAYLSTFQCVLCLPAQDVSIQSLMCLTKIDHPAAVPEFNNTVAPFKRRIGTTS